MMVGVGGGFIVSEGVYCFVGECVVAPPFMINSWGAFLQAYCKGKTINWGRGPNSPYLVSALCFVGYISFLDIQCLIVHVW